MKERILVVAAYIKRDEQLLLTKRPANKAQGGLWEFPGGKIEPGESPKNALIREIREELGIEIEVGDLLAEIEHDYPEVKIKLICYAAKIIEGEPRPLEGQKITWISPKDVINLELSEADQRLWFTLEKESI